MYQRRGGNRWPDDDRDSPVHPWSRSSPTTAPPVVCGALYNTPAGGAAIAPSGQAAPY